MQLNMIYDTCFWELIKTQTPQSRNSLTKNTSSGITKGSQTLVKILCKLVHIAKYHEWTINDVNQLVWSIHLRI